MTVSPASPTLSLEELEPHRRELTGYCYRMLGSAFEADDAVQETLVRAWKAADRFEGRSSVRSWLYRIATNVCLDMLRGRERRARPMELGPSRPPEPQFLEDVRAEHAWVTPIPDALLDPADIAESRETIRLAFVTALQHLPPKQRAALILCEVLKWQASEAAELLETSTAAINSALQRARATLSSVPVGASSAAAAVDSALLERYVEAFERYDVQAFVKLLAEDAVQSMPPYAMWLQGAENIGAWLLGPGAGCRGSVLLPTMANGLPAFGQYRVDPEGGHTPWALQVLEWSESGDQITGFHAFLDTRLFARFGLPEHLPA